MNTACQALSPNDLNFSAGPGALPRVVLERAQAAIEALPETGLSILGMSHRTAWFEALLARVQADLRALAGIPPRFRILFLQGGSSLQFSMIPMNFAAGPGRRADYVASGYWSRKSIAEASAVVDAHVAWDGAPGGYRTLPDWSALAPSRDGAYLHYVSNETIEGLQFAGPPPDAGQPVICDMSSDFLSRQLDVTRFGMVYAHAQKNLGPAGVTVAVLDEALLERVPPGLPPMLDFRTHVAHGSNYNTPPVFSIYVLGLVLQWMREEFTTLEALERRNARKAALVYDALAACGEAVQVHAAPGHRSRTNIALRFADPRVQSRFFAQAAEEGFSGLAGHRSLGGARISLYNAVGEEAAAELAAFIRAFGAAHG